MDNSLNVRLDAHESQIQQLKRDVTAIRTTLMRLEEERVESSKFRQDVLAWMIQQEQKSVNSSLDSGFSSEVFSFSSPKNGSVASNSNKSVLYGAPGLPWAVEKVRPSLLARLEVLVSRSEDRLLGHGHQFHAGHLNASGPPNSDSTTIISVEGTLAKISTEFNSNINEKIIGTNQDESDVLEIKHLDEVINPSNLDWFDIQKESGSGSGHDSGMDISSLGLASPNSRIPDFTKSENPVFKPQPDVFEPSPTLNVHLRGYQIGSELLDLQTFEWKPGWEFGWFDYAQYPALFPSCLLERLI